MPAGEELLRFQDAVVSWRDIIYKTLGQVGKGGSSYVYRAIACSGGSRGNLFAVKVFRSVDREGWLLKFMREAHVLRDCNHPGIVKIFDEGVYLDKYPFFVMELLPARLTTRIKDKSLSEAEKLSLVSQLLSALSYLARRDPPAVHRDIKPSNIFLKSDSCVLGDFGLIFQSPSAVGTPPAAPLSDSVPEMARNYPTPELVAFQHNGVNPSPASDVFQLGLVAAEMFTGKNPVDPYNAHKQIHVHSIEPMSSPLGPTIKSLIEQMLILDTLSRPSASDMLDKWLGLYLESCRRESNARRSSQVNKLPTASMNSVTLADKTTDRRKRAFGEGVLE